MTQNKQGSAIDILGETSCRTQQKMRSMDIKFVLEHKKAHPRHA